MTIDETRTTRLEDLGWDAGWAECLAALALQGTMPARVSAVLGPTYHVEGAAGLHDAVLSGRGLHESEAGASLPAVGDWVALDAPGAGSPGVIRAVLPRRGKLSRKVAGTTTVEQVVAANVDTALLVSGLDLDFNPRRVERMLVAVWESDACPVVLLNKADACPEVEARVRRMQASAPGVDVFPVSALTGQGLDAVAPHLRDGRTLVMLGSSGVGKTTLLNRLAGTELQPTQTIRSQDGRGRHTTTHRQMFRLPHGAWMIDTPGIRELQLWDGGEGLERTFSEIEEAAAGCRFRDCTHTHEPGCAVRAAVESGRVDDGRLRNYRKLEREIRFQEKRHDVRARLEEKRRWRVISKLCRSFQRGT